MKVESLIVQLTKILGNWDKGANILVTQTEEKYPLNQQNVSLKDPLLHAKDPAVLLGKKLYSANVDNLLYFVCSIQFNIEEPKTYKKIMQGFNAVQ